MLAKINAFFSEYYDIKNKPIISGYEIFFRQYGDLTTNNLNKIEHLFSEFAPMAQRIQAERLRMAPRFNVFTALQIHEDEVLTSRFLAYLLDPRKHHDQDATFLISFIKFTLNEDKSYNIAKRARVTPERWVGTFGRLDIAIEFPDGQIVAIENKINHEERTNQICDYQTWLSLQRAAAHAVIYLTLDGRQSETAALHGIRVITLSYTRLAEWLSSVPVPDRLAVVIRQFCDNFI